MSFLGKLKDVSGIGLNAEEQFRRAYEKGVFLQPPDYDGAIKWFTESAKNFSKEGKTDRADRANASAALYRLIAQHSRDLIGPTIDALRKLPEIERPGSQTETVPTSQMIAELSGLEIEHQAESVADPKEKATRYKQAADLFMPNGSRELLFADKLSYPGPTDSFTKRAFYCMAASDLHSAEAVIYEFPDQALDFFQRSVSLYRQAQQSQQEAEITSRIQRVQTKRHCWMCNREMQGNGLFYRYYPAGVAPYHRHLVNQLKQDTGMVETDGAVTLCTVCGTAIEQQADAYALLRSKEVREWAVPIFDSHAAAINTLQEAVRELQRHSHSH